MTPTPAVDSPKPTGAASQPRPRRLRIAQPRSLQSRQLWAASLGLVAFLALAGFALDRAFLSTAQSGMRERLHSYALAYANSDFARDGSVIPPYDPPDPRFRRPGSGLYAQILQPTKRWESESAQGPRLPDAAMLAPRDGYCVVAHEIAHKLDALDGAMDGTPPLPRDWQLQWASDFQRAYDALCATVDAGDDSPIDDYATESPEEFFAVCTEYHFSDPARLRNAMPEVAAHLQRFYGAPLLA